MQLMNQSQVTGPALSSSTHRLGKVNTLGESSPAGGVKEPRTYIHAYCAEAVKFLESVASTSSVHRRSGMAFNVCCQFTVQDRQFELLQDKTLI